MILDCCRLAAVSGIRKELADRVADPARPLRGSKRSTNMDSIWVRSYYVAYAIRKVHAMAGRKIAVVGHSQGGMMMRIGLRFWPDTRKMVDDVIGYRDQRIDEVVTPQPGASSVANPEKITNVSIQDVCLATMAEHLQIGTRDPAAAALTLDALSHKGPATIAD